MKPIKSIVSSLFLCFLLINACIDSVSAQSTWDDIHTIFQTSCVTGCHGGVQPDGNLDLSGTSSDVYNRIIGVDPTNPEAKSRGFKLIDKGMVARSFIFRKIDNNLDPTINLSVAEGSKMPKNNPNPLGNEELEQIRQWIQFGAPKNGYIGSKTRITDVYTGKAAPRVTPLPPPPAGEGFQVYYGPLILAAKTEKEYRFKYPMMFDDSTEVSRIEVKMSTESHHFIIYKYQANGHQNVDPGFQPITSLIDQFDINNNARPLITWQYDRDVELPEGTAYIWDKDAVLDLNFHIANTHDSTLAAEVYINFYTQAKGTAEAAMQATLANYGGQNPFQLNVLNNNKDTTFVMEQYFNNPSTWYIWTLQAHTHKLGIDYDMFLRNPNGTKGEQIYEGFYDADYNFNQGFYDYEHPAVLEYDTLLPVNMEHGLIHEASYRNNGPSNVTFGITTDDEMFITYMQYTLKRPEVLEPTSIRDIKETNSEFEISPNPFMNDFRIKYNLQNKGNVRIDLYNLLGEHISKLKDVTETAGNYELNVSPVLKMEKGIYLVKMSIDGNESSRILVKMN